MSRFSRCLKCHKKGFYVSVYDTPTEDGELFICRYCEHSVRIVQKSAGVEYRGYTLTVDPPRKGSNGEDRYEGLGKKQGVKDVYAHYMISPDEALAKLKRNVDYWEGIEGIEDKTNKELADYLVDDLLSDLKIDLTASQARFLLEVADRLNRIEDKLDRISSQLGMP